jgi:WD40 repeat protein
MFEAVSIHNRKINTISLEPGEGRLLATSGTDGSIAIWDVRKLTEGE